MHWSLVTVVSGVDLLDVLSQSLRSGEDLRTMFAGDSFSFSHSGSFLFDVQVNLMMLPGVVLQSLQSDSHNFDLVLLRVLHGAVSHADHLLTLLPPI